MMIENHTEHLALMIQSEVRNKNSACIRIVYPPTITRYLQALDDPEDIRKSLQRLEGGCFIDAIIWV